MSAGKRRRASAKDFNSIKVQLESSEKADDVALDLFQFHKGSIRIAELLNQVEKERHFNSIKVQLESLICMRRTSGCLFQFHKGSIRIESSFRKYIKITLFQFHKGSIRIEALRDKLVLAQLFQFHKGSIRIVHPKVREIIKK